MFITINAIIENKPLCFAVLFGFGLLMAYGGFPLVGFISGGLAAWRLIS